MQELVLRGTPYERGYEHGKRFAGDIVAGVESFKHESEGQDVLSAINENVDFMDKHFPEINEEIRGISEGANVPFTDVFLFNNRAIVTTTDRENCSDIAIFNNGNAVIGMNKDRPQPLPEYDGYFLRKVYPDKGHAFISYGHVGRLWGHGMNEAGLCTAGTTAYPRKAESRVPSLGSYLLPPVLLAKCKDTPEALDLIEQLEYICDPGNFLLCDVSGRMVAIEISPGKRVMRKPQRDQLIVTTFFSSGQIEHNDDCAYLEESEQRFSTIEHALTREDGTGLDVVRNILRTHSDKGSVCQHNEMGYSTVLSWTALPSLQEFYLLEGSPCENDYILYRLKD